MVSVSTIIAVIITLGIVTIVPLGAYILYGVKNKGKGVWVAWLIGAAGFFVMQILIRVPILSVVQLIPGFMSFVENYYILYCAMLAVTAAGFELVARIVVAKIMSKNLTYEKSFAAGLGHGGIESIFLIGTTYLNNILYIIMINTGVYDKMVAESGATGATYDQLISVKEQLVNMSSATFYLAGLERVLTMIIHLALTLIVCYCMKNGHLLKGAVICMLVHTAVDFVTPMISGLATPYLGNVISTNTSYVLVYSFLGLVTVGCIVDIKIVTDKWKREVKEVAL